MAGGAADRNGELLRSNQVSGFASAGSVLRPAPFTVRTMGVWRWVGQAESGSAGRLATGSNRKITAETANKAAMKYTAAENPPHS